MKKFVITEDKLQALQTFIQDIPFKWGAPIAQWLGAEFKELVEEPKEEPAE
jgi:hypothetical protein